MTDEDDTTEYTTDRGVTLYVFRGTSDRRMATLRGEMDDIRKADEERRAARTRGA